MSASVTKKPLIAVLTAIPKVSSSLNPELNSLPVQLLPNPSGVTFDGKTAINQYPKEWLSELDRAEIVISDPQNLGIFKDYLSSLRWCQSTFAGPDATVKTIRNTPTLLDRMESNSLQITRVGSRLSMPISEYVVGMIIRIERRFDDMMNAQKLSTWTQGEYSVTGYRTMKRLKFGIFGAGDIGMTIAKSLKYGFGAQHLIALCRTSKDHDAEYQEIFERCYTFKELDKLHYIICALPHTEETRHLLTAERLQKCRTKPYLINVGRGSLIETAELIKALDSEVIKGAVLDVFQEEPLSEESQLWQRNDVIISPHVSGLTFCEDLIGVFMGNLDHYLNGEELQYLVDVHRGY